MWFQATTYVDLHSMSCEMIIMLKHGIIPKLCVTSPEMQVSLMAPQTPTSFLCDLKVGQSHLILVPPPPS